jgi:hypothetical protein
MSGGVDLCFQLRRPRSGAAERPRVRVLEGIGRFEVAESLEVELLETGEYVALGAPAPMPEKETALEKAIKLIPTLLGVAPDRALAALHEDLVEVGGEHVERELARLQVVPQPHDFVPGFPG